MALPKNVKPELNKFVSATVGTAQAFVVTRVQKEVDKIIQDLTSQCPPPEKLEKFSATISSLRLAITFTDKRVQRAGDIAKYLEPTILAANLIIEIITNLPLPPVFATPPGPIPSGPFGPYGVLNSETIAIQAKRNARVQWLQNLVETLTDEGRAIAQIVAGATGSLSSVRVKLGTIDALIQACMVNQELTDEERKRIVDNIQGTYQDPSSFSTTYTSTSGYTYNIKVIKDPNSPNIAPRRQAIVQDFRGITVLTGPSSFASNPQILIEEIKFRIENQLP